MESIFENDLTESGPKCIEKHFITLLSKSNRINFSLEVNVKDLLIQFSMLNISISCT